MPSFLVESYLPRGRARERHAMEQRARSAAAELNARRLRIAFERSIYVPEDETCFFVFAAPSARHAERTARQAGLEPIRVVEAITQPFPPEGEPQ